MTKDQLRNLLEGLSDADLRSLRAIINGRLSAGISRGPRKGIKHKPKS